ncbi:hypothetical protein E7Y35_06450 [Spiroplasma sp. SV19]|nr:hypothetical protein E7Y35_06450 [Spiroplasma sp. SV19]
MENKIMDYICLYKNLKKINQFDFNYEKMLKKFKSIKLILTKNNFISEDQIELKGSIKTKTVYFKKNWKDNDLDILIKYNESKLDIKNLKK